MIALAFSPIFLPMGLAPVVLGLAAVGWVLFWAFPEVRRGRYPLACFVTGALLGGLSGLFLAIAAENPLLLPVAVPILGLAAGLLTVRIGAAAFPEGPSGSPPHT